MLNAWFFLDTSVDFADGQLPHLGLQSTGLLDLSIPEGCFGMEGDD